VPFKMIIRSKAVNGARGGAHFRKASGRGFVELKCKAEVAEVEQIGNINFWISVGNGPHAHDPRGPVSHNFASSSAVCALPEENDEWDFSSVVDEPSQTFLVSLDIMPVGCYGGRGHLRGGRDRVP